MDWTIIKNAFTTLVREFGYDFSWDLFKGAAKGLLFKQDTNGRITGINQGAWSNIGPKFLKQEGNVVALYNILLHDNRISVNERKALDGFLSDRPKTLPLPAGAAPGTPAPPNPNYMGENQCASFMANVVWMAYGAPDNNTVPGDIDKAIAMLKEFADMPSHQERKRRADAKNLIRGNEDDYPVYVVEQFLKTTFTTTRDFITGVVHFATNNRAQATTLLGPGFMGTLDSIERWNNRLPFIAAGTTIAYIAIHCGLVFLGHPWLHPLSAMYTVLALLASYVALWRMTGLFGTGALLLYEADWSPAKTVIRGIQKISLGALLAGIYFTFAPHTAPLFWPLTCVIFMFVTMYLVLGGGVDIQKWRKVAIVGVAASMLAIIGSAFLTQAPASVPANGFPGFWDDFPLPGGPLLPVLAVLGALALMFRGRFGNDSHSTPAGQRPGSGNH